MNHPSVIISMTESIIRITEPTRRTTSWHRHINLNHLFSSPFAYSIAGLRLVRLLYQILALLLLHDIPYNRHDVAIPSFQVLLSHRKMDMVLIFSFLFYLSIRLPVFPGCQMSFHQPVVLCRSRSIRDYQLPAAEIWVLYSPWHAGSESN